MLFRSTTRVSATTSGAALTVLAGRNANGERAVLIANTGTTAGSWTLNGTTGSGSVYKMQEISGSAASIVSSTLSSLSSSIPAYGVQLVTISSGPSAVISAIAGAGGSVPAVSSISPNGYFTIYGSGFAAAGTSRKIGRAHV